VANRIEGTVSVFRRDYLFFWWNLSYKGDFKLRNPQMDQATYLDRIYFSYYS